MLHIKHDIHIDRYVEGEVDGNMIKGVFGRDRGKTQDLWRRYVKTILNCPHVCENFLHVCNATL